MNDERQLRPPVHLLIATLGNSDVVPDDINDGRPKKARPLGGSLLEAIERGEQPRFQVPLLEPVVRALRQGPERLDRIVLIATDQDPTTPERYRESDTVCFAQLLRHWLASSDGFDADAVEIVTFGGNPADYGQTFPFMRRTLARLRDRWPERPATCHLAPTGGTPALAAALLVEGVAAFGAGAIVHYVSRGEDKARTVDVVADLLAQRLRRDLTAHVRADDYAAALALARQDQAFEVLVPDPDTRTLILALLTHAAERLNANLSAAQAALATVSLRALTDVEREAVRLVPEHAPAAERDAQTVREVIASAEVMLRTGHYFDFTTRFGTFRDTYPRFIVLHRLGGRLELAGQTETLEPWIREHPELCRYLMDDKKCHIDGAPTTKVLTLTIAFFAKHDAAVKPLHKAVASQQLERVSALRNAGVHRFGEIGRQQLRDAWGDEVETIVPRLRKMAALAGIELPADNPYNTIRAAVLRLLGEGVAAS